MNLCIAEQDAQIHYNCSHVAATWSDQPLGMVDDIMQTIYGESLKSPAAATFNRPGGQ